MFLFLIISQSIVLINWGNQLSVNLGGQLIFNIDLILESIQGDWSSINNWWVYALIFSTLAPTFLHFCLVSLSIVTYVPNSVINFATKFFRHGDSSLAYSLWHAISPVIYVYLFWKIGNFTIMHFDPEWMAFVPEQFLQWAHNLNESTNHF